jgi:hypothetical protein
MFVVALIYEIIHSCSFYNYFVGLKHPHSICSWCIYILMWSPTKLEFLFYDFSVTYYNFIAKTLH